MRSDFRTLIVEDHPHMRALLRPVVRAIVGGDVIEARDGTEALELMRAHVFHLVLVDLKLPLLDGLELIRLIRTADDSPYPTVPILVVSAYGTRAMAAAARDAGANAFVTKPVSAQRLHGHIDKVLRDDRPFVRAPNYFGPDRRRPPGRGATPYHLKRRRTDQ